MPMPPDEDERPFRPLGNVVPDPPFYQPVEQDEEEAGLLADVQMQEIIRAVRNEDDPPQL